MELKRKSMISLQNSEDYLLSMYSLIFLLVFTMSTQHCLPTAAQPGATRMDSSQPGAARMESTKKMESSQPKGLRMESSQPSGARTESSQRSGSKLDSNRNLYQIYGLLSQDGNCSMVQWASLISHGNWCGYGNTGLPPVDEFDHCCMLHDQCYDSIQNDSSCEKLHPVLVMYDWSQDTSGHLLCVDCLSESKKESIKNAPIILGLPSDENLVEKAKNWLEELLGLSHPETGGKNCGCRTCTCDLELARCIHNARKCPSGILGL